MDDDSQAPTTESTNDTPAAAPERPLSLLASETFGANYKGEARKPVEAENPSPEKPAEAPEADEPTDDAGEGGEDAQEALEKPEGEDGPEEVAISTVSELVQHLEADPEWFNSLKVPVKINHEDRETTLADLVANFQKHGAADKYLEEARAKAKDLVREQTQKAEELTAQYATVANLVANAEKLLDQDVGAVNWDDLRENDPAEYAAKHAEIRERRERIDQMKREAVQSWQDNAAKQAEEAKQHKQQHLQAEAEALLEKVPEWRDSERAKNEKAELADYLIGQGFTRDDVMGASDHRLIVMARKAKLFDEMSSKTDAARKKVAKVPKVMRPGTPPPQHELESRKLNDLKTRLKKSGSVDDAFALLRATRR